MQLKLDVLHVDLPSVCLDLLLLILLGSQARLRFSRLRLQFSLCFFKLLLEVLVLFLGLLEFVDGRVYASLLFPLRFLQVTDLLCLVSHFFITVTNLRMELGNSVLQLPPLSFKLLLKRTLPDFDLLHGHCVYI